MPERADLSALLGELNDLLVEERRVLLSGSPERVTGIVERKLALAEAIEPLTPAEAGTAAWRDTVVQLDRYNRENAIICGAMLRHLTAAIDALRQHDPHRSYTLGGAEQRSLPVHHALGAA